MNQSERSITVTIIGDLVEWLEQEADHNTRTPEQHVAHLLQGRRETQERGKQRRAERAEKRKALGLSGYRKAA